MSKLPTHPRLFPCRPRDSDRIVDNTVEFHRVCLNGGSATLRFESEVQAIEFMGNAKRLVEMRG